ncbi:hypothetical protein AMTRI_Chr07g27070 [Amborella trichopoda]
MLKDSVGHETIWSPASSVQKLLGPGLWIQHRDAPPPPPPSHCRVSYARVAGPCNLASSSPPPSLKLYPSSPHVPSPPPLSPLCPLLPSPFSPSSPFCISIPTDEVKKAKTKLLVSLVCDLVYPIPLSCSLASPPSPFFLVAKKDCRHKRRRRPLDLGRGDGPLYQVPPYPSSPPSNLDPLLASPITLIQPLVASLHRDRCTGKEVQQDLSFCPDPTPSFSKPLPPPATPQLVVSSSPDTCLFSVAHLLASDGCPPAASPSRAMYLPSGPPSLDVCLSSMADSMDTCPPPLSRSAVACFPSAASSPAGCTSVLLPYPLEARRWSLRLLRRPFLQFPLAKCFPSRPPAVSAFPSPLPIPPRLPRSLSHCLRPEFMSLVWKLGPPRILPPESWVSFSLTWKVPTTLPFLPALRPRLWPCGSPCQVSHHPLPLVLSRRPSRCFVFSPLTFFPYGRWEQQRKDLVSSAATLASLNWPRASLWKTGVCSASLHCLVPHGFIPHFVRVHRVHTCHHCLGPFWFTHHLVSNSLSLALLPPSSVLVPSFPPSPSFFSPTLLSPLSSPSPPPLPLDTTYPFPSSTPLPLSFTPAYSSVPPPSPLNVLPLPLNLYPSFSPLQSPVRHEPKLFVAHLDEPRPLALTGDSNRMVVGDRLEELARASLDSFSSPLTASTLVGVDEEEKVRELDRVNNMLRVMGFHSTKVLRSRRCPKIHGTQTTSEVGFKGKREFLNLFSSLEVLMLR